MQHNTHHAMDSQLIPLSDFRLPDHSKAALNLNGSPLSIIDPSSLTPETTGESITPAIGLATVLYKWHPNALAAFLDLDAWFSLTWTLSIAEGTPEGSKIEIGRIGNQITFGSLDSSGDNWTLMLTYNIVLEGEDRGKWIPNPKESMLGEEDVTDPEEIEKLGKEFVEKIVREKRWETGKKMKHRFFVEYAPMDVWGDGIPMSPHWMYSSLDLSRCTACKKTGVALQRCGRCGTSTYCSDVCQKGDWAVHKDVCSMSMEDRGQAIKLSEKGGLIMWDVEKTYAKEEGEMSANPNFEIPQVKRRVMQDT
ncbi:hypothetical protein J4E89_001674 [Alternaria sp. Ai002NY15]|nr:hypothetical protein J4E80_002427 [Alternaria sp. BMP 0032]KAI4714224.1 hypothetical protein J4E89_001674 [Alternaria sp. Ai002NY15]